jgi:hypothetical protein
VRIFLLLLLAATLGLASMATAQAPGPAPGDRDHDGVPDSADLCPDRGDQPGRKTEADGCPAFSAGIILVDGGDIAKLAKDSKIPGQAQCYWSRGDTCSFTATLTLSASSAKKLKLKNRKIGDIEVDASNEQQHYGLRYGNFSWGFSSAVKRALKKADEVTVTLAGTYKRGSAKPVTITPSTFKAVTDPSGSPMEGIPPRQAPTDG